MTTPQDSNTSAGGICPEGIVFSDDVKRAYEATFFTRFSIKPKRCICFTESLWSQVKRIVTILGGDKATMGTYVQNIIDFHLDENKVVIAELTAASFLSDTDEKAMNSLSTAARKYQACFLTGDGVNRTTNQIYVSRDCAQRLKRIVKDVGGENPTIGGYVDAILREHFDDCADLIAEMTNDKYRKPI